MSWLCHSNSIQRWWQFVSLPMDVIHIFINSSYWVPGTGNNPTWIICDPCPQRAQLRIKSKPLIWLKRPSMSWHWSHSKVDLPVVPPTTNFVFSSRLCNCYSLQPDRHFFACLQWLALLFHIKPSAWMSPPQRNSR